MARTSIAPARRCTRSGSLTAIGACAYLLGSGVEPDRITWVRPRDQWLLDRASMQPLEQVGSFIEGFALDLDAAANARSVEDLFARRAPAGRRRS